MHQQLQDETITLGLGATYISEFTVYYTWIPVGDYITIDFREMLLLVDYLRSRKIKFFVKLELHV